jgi:hypothetical protein
MLPVRLVGFVALAAGVAACDAIASVAVSAADFGGATASAHCDRRFVTDAGVPSAFCQEIVDTVAAAQFADDCRTKHEATAGPGLCPRPGIIAGCKLGDHTDDGSQIWDWYYRVADAGADVDAASIYQPPIPDGVLQVASTCADRGRYEAGAELAFP